MKSVTETFGYDSQNRLTGVWPHAMDAATTTEGVFPATDQTVAYTSFDKVSKVKQGNDSLCYTYGYDHQRIFMEEHVGITSRAKRYVGNCEYITETNGNITDTQWLTYLSGPTGVYAVVMTKSGSDQIFFVLKDNLGSWTAITDENGTVEQRLSYDPWGRRRNTTNFGYGNASHTFDRGYTLHEHYDDFDLINRNGRMYDPVVSSFLSVDQYVQSPENAQGFNRYAYCMNNPLRYIDPSGWRAGGGIVGYTPNSFSNANDPYAFVEHGCFLEPRDLGLRQLPYSDPIITWMEGNERNPGGNGGGNNGKGNPIIFVLLDYQKKYQHYLQSDLKGCKIATARAYYQYFSEEDLGEATFSTIANGLGAVDGNVTIKEYYEECGLNVEDGMSVDIIEIGENLEEGHPYSIILKGEHIQGMTDIDHVVTMIGIYKEQNEPLKVFIKDPLQKDGQYFNWIEFRQNIKDAYFITGLKNH